MRKIIVRALNAVGVSDVIEANDGREALDAFSAGGFDLVLTGWNMSHKTGLEVLRGIRASDSAVPVVMITTEGDRRRVVEAIDSGVTDYLLKPFTADLLREKLESLRPLRGST